MNVQNASRFVFWMPRYLLLAECHARGQKVWMFPFSLPSETDTNCGIHIYYMTTMARPD